MMTEPMIQIEIDPAAALAYIELGSQQVERTEEFTPEIMVDLDAFGMVVGLELLSLTVAIDDTLRIRFAEKYHVPSPILELLPLAFRAVANWNRQNVTQKSSRSASRRSSYGVLQPSHVTQLTECSK